LPGYSIDVSIPSLRVAIEADGPSHVSRNKGPGGAPVRLGATRMKARHLRAMGWRVVSVGFQEWDGTPQAARESFLRARIAAAR
jgi:very-short-patch-repair endonuclease